MVAVISDIHINLKRHAAFEDARVMELADRLNQRNYRIIIINGDLFDSARPTLQEIKLAQEFITSLADWASVYLLNGNHESIDTSLKLSTFDFIKMHDCIYVKDAVLTFAGKKFRLTSWSHLKSLTTHKDADVLVTHVRSDLPPHITAERDMSFLEDYKLCILGDIHHKHSPAPNAHYTNSPYSVNFSSASPDGSYIEIDDDLNWNYVDLKLPQKIKLVGVVKDFKEFKPRPESIYKVFVEDTIEELRKLPYHKNVTYTKIVKQVTATADDIPETTDLLELLVDRITEINKYNEVMMNRTQKIIGGLLDEVNS